jgi:hypothetical protein
MNSKQKSTGELPIKGKLTALCASTVVILVLMTAASLAGVLYSHSVYPADDLRKMLMPNDVVNLCIELPFMLFSLLLIWQNKLTGSLALVGALLSILYNYLVYVLAMPIGIAFAVHLALVILSACALVSLIVHIDASAVRQCFARPIPERAASAVLAGLGVLIFFRASGILLRGVVHQTPIARAEFAVSVADSLIAPLWIIGGVILIFRKPFGYVAALGLLTQASLLFIGLIVFLLLQPFFTGVPVHWRDVVLIFAMGSVCFVPLILFVRGIESR